jgi:tRNA(Ile)-lysidine synthase
MMAKLRLGIDRGLLKPSDRLCVAISGGADSTALLLALSEANTGKQPLGLVLTAAHVHHGLRGVEADGDEEFVRQLCTHLAVPLTVFRVDTAARQAAEGEGLEEAARALRYEALASLIRSGAVDAVATAHTLDDQAETVIMKLLRGAWTEGLGGISPGVQTPPGRLVRPLLNTRRAEVEAFLRARDQTWRDDASNLDVSLTRNRVRHQLMPLLREFNPAIDALLSRTAEIARDEEAFWRTETDRILPQILLPGKPVRGGGRSVSTAVGDASFALEIARLSAMPAALRRRVVRAAAKSLYPKEVRSPSLNSQETAKVLALAGFGGQTDAPGRIGNRLELRQGLRVERSARELRFWLQREIEEPRGTRQKRIFSGQKRSSE